MPIQFGGVPDGRGRCRRPRAGRPPISIIPVPNRNFSGSTSCRSAWPGCRPAHTHPRAIGNIIAVAAVLLNPHRQKREDEAEGQQYPGRWLLPTNFRDMMPYARRLARPCIACFREHEAAEEQVDDRVGG